MFASLKNLFNSQPLLDQGSQQWIIDTFAWAIKEFDQSVFINHSRLIKPTNEFYPGKVGSVEEMAQAVFDNTIEFAGMKHWPIKLVSPDYFHQHQLQNQKMAKLSFSTAMRGNSSKLIHIDAPDTHNTDILISFNPAQINQPQDLVASFAQSFASILVTQRGVLPPGGQDFLPQAVDLVACFMGFGVMFANTAYQFKGGCGSCYNKYANRQVALPEQEMLYCLALFSVLKDIKPSEVTVQLKSHLRSDFKKAIKEINNDVMRKNSALRLIKQSP